jgi:molecular chaperone GrpE
MASDRKPTSSNSIPIHFLDGEDSSAPEQPAGDAYDPEMVEVELSEDPEVEETPHGGPELAELVASRAELKRLQTALSEAQDALARRQADFENYRKRIERERHELHNRVVADVARKLLPVLDNLTRALDAERSVEASESAEFRHFLHGVELISKQLNDVLDSFGIQIIPSVGERFDPHIHEAVVSEPSDEYEPDTVIEEMSRGYRIGERLLRPAMVKVAARPPEPDTENS